MTNVFLSRDRAYERDRGSPVLASTLAAGRILGAPSVLGELFAVPFSACVAMAWSLSGQPTSRCGRCILYAGFGLYSAFAVAGNFRAFKADEKTAPQSIGQGLA